MMNTLLTNRIKAKFTGKQIQNKLTLRKIFLNKIAKDRNFYTQNNTILILTGLQYERCIKELASRKLINKKSSKIVIVERDRQIYETIHYLAQSCPFYQRDKVKIHNCELKDIAYHDLQIQDLDFTGTWKTCYDIIDHRLKGQKDNCPEWQRKYIMFNLSERNGGGLETSFQKLQSLLSENLDFQLKGLNDTVGGFGKGLEIPTWSGWWIKEYKPLIDDKKWGRVKSFGLYRYRDTVPMTTCYIAYK